MNDFIFGNAWFTPRLDVHTAKGRLSGIKYDHIDSNRSPLAMKLTGSPVTFTAKGQLSSSERTIVSDWLSHRLEVYHRKINKTSSLPNQQAIMGLIKSGLSPLKRRYHNSALSAHAVVWGWLGRECLLGKIDPSVVRPRQGGTSQHEWKWTSMLGGGWLPPTARVSEAQRQERLLSCLPRCSGAVQSGTGWYLGPHCLTALHQMLRRHYPEGWGLRAGLGSICFHSM